VSLSLELVATQANVVSLSLELLPTQNQAVLDHIHLEAVCHLSEEGTVKVLVYMLMKMMSSFLRTRNFLIHTKNIIT
jgi:hypothetical protein